MSEVRNTRRVGVTEVQRIDPVRPLERRRAGDEPQGDEREQGQEAPKHGTQHGADHGAGHGREHGTEHTSTDVTYGMNGELPEDDDDGDDANIDEYV